MFPAIGSTIIAATLSSFLFNKFSTDIWLLYSAISVSLAIFLVTPGLSGKPSVKAPEPALIKKLSPWP